MPSGTEARLDRARQAMREQNLPALLITQIDNVGWISGFSGSNGFVILTPERALFATDSRYTTQAENQCAGFELLKLATSAPDEITGILAGIGAPKIGFESGHMTVGVHQTYREKLDSGIELVATTGLIDSLRMAKDADELGRIRRAVNVADRAFDHILPYLKPGAVERDVMLELEWFMRRECGADVAFDTIVASGPRSALPHGRAANRAMESGDMVTLDFGARLDGYCSDITRTVSLGRASDEQRKVYGIVRDALYKTIDALRPGANGKAVDAIGRDFIKAAGYGDYFGHGMGHSLGRAVHDGHGLSIRADKVTLPENMVITVEPGIYLPDRFGVRIEHNVLITASSPEVLDRSTTELLEL